ncbi:MAG: hypothetical protein ACTHLW_04715 [Verrucomicrobiota bacterium]
MNIKFQFSVVTAFTLLAVLQFAGCASPESKETPGKPFQDSQHAGGPQKIPGRVQCAAYDFGGEGVAYHDTDSINEGSGRLNPANGTYLNEFRIGEAVDTSYTKFHDTVDNSPFNRVQPSEGQLYVGWTAPGEWFNLSVEVERAGVYTMDLLYTSNRGGKIALDRNGRPLASGLELTSTRDDREPLAWRQWHHWNVMTNLAEVKLPKGRSVLTVHIVTEGNMNLAWLDFKAK